MSDTSHEQVRRAMEGMKSFAQDMREQGIHVGMGANPVCVTCGERWPCVASSEHET